MVNHEFLFSGMNRQSMQYIALTGKHKGFSIDSHAISEEVTHGTDLFILNMFEQGFYDRLGFGTGPYKNYVKFHPYQLSVPDLARSPKRLSMDQFKVMHQDYLERQRGHGKNFFKN